MKNDNVFARREQKYLLTAKQFAELSVCLSEKTELDEYGAETVSSLYYDTPDSRMIRNSIEKPDYREKLRLRGYGEITSDSDVYLEIKRKAGGTVYKRRVALSYKSALLYLHSGIYPENLTPRQKQIMRELDAMIAFYSPVPAAFISYRRTALKGKEDSELRITLDSDITYRTDKLTLTESGGVCILPKGFYVMEIKSFGGLPMWLTKALSKYEIYPAGYSKYGNCYKDTLKRNAVSNSGETPAKKTKAEMKGAKSA